jgi:hypothetical protein
MWLRVGGEEGWKRRQDHVKGCSMLFNGICYWNYRISSRKKGEVKESLMKPCIFVKGE